MPKTQGESPMFLNIRVVTHTPIYYRMIVI